MMQSTRRLAPIHAHLSAPGAGDEDATAAVEVETKTLDITNMAEAAGRGPHCHWGSGRILLFSRAKRYLLVQNAEFSNAQLYGQSYGTSLLVILFSS
jgi:hypothetical protein